MSNPSSQSDAETVDNHVQVLKSLPVNLSLSTEPQEAKREPFTSSSGPGGDAGDGGDGNSPTLTVVKAEMYTPVFMAGLHYRMEEEEPSPRVIYEQDPYEVTTVSHISYVKEDRQSPPGSPYEEERDGVRNHHWTGSCSRFRVASVVSVTRRRLTASSQLKGFGCCSELASSFCVLASVSAEVPHAVLSGDR